MFLCVADEWTSPRQRTYLGRALLHQFVHADQDFECNDGALQDWPAAEVCNDLRTEGLTLSNYAGAVTGIS